MPSPHWHAALIGHLYPPNLVYTVKLAPEEEACQTKQAQSRQRVGRVLHPPERMTRFGIDLPTSTPPDLPLVDHPLESLLYHW